MPAWIRIAAAMGIVVLVAVFIPMFVSVFTPEADLLPPWALGICVVATIVICLLMGFAWLRQLYQTPVASRPCVPALLVLILYGLVSLLYASGYRAATLLGSPVKMRDAETGEWAKASTCGELVYFSFVTGSTLGYGDAVPVGSVSRVLVCTEVVSLWLILVVGFLAVQTSLIQWLGGQPGPGRRGGPRWPPGTPGESRVAVALASNFLG